MGYPEYIEHSLIVFNTKNKEARFPHKNDIEKYKSNPDFILFSIGDTVTFKGYPHLGDEKKIKTGVIKKLGYGRRLGIYDNILCGVKVEGEKFGSALLYNYEISPICLTKQ